MMHIQLLRNKQLRRNNFTIPSRRENVTNNFELNKVYLGYQVIHFENAIINIYLSPYPDYAIIT